MLPRTAKLEGSRTTGPPPEQDTPLDIPKRTAVYIEQVITITIIIIVLIIIIVIMTTNNLKVSSR